MINEERILEILIKVQETQQQMQTEFSQMREEQMQMREDIQQIKGRLNRVEDQVTRTAAYQENVMQPAIDAIGEGLEMTQQMMKELTSKRETDELRDQVEILRTVVALHSREIEALKKAQ